MTNISTSVKKSKTSVVVAEKSPKMAKKSLQLKKAATAPKTKADTPMKQKKTQPKKSSKVTTTKDVEMKLTDASPKQKNKQTEKRKLDHGDSPQSAKKSKTTKTSSEAVETPSKDGEKAKKDYKYTLFVGGIPYGISKTKVELYFKKFGKVLNVTLPMLRQSNRNKGFCFVSYASAESMEKVLKTDHKIDNKKVQVQKRKTESEKLKEPKEPKKAKEPKKVVDETHKIYVGDLDRTTKKNAITEHFSKFGKIASTILPFFNQTKRNKGFCHIIFADAAGKAAALQAKKHKVDGSVLDVQESEPTAKPAAKSSKKEAKAAKAKKVVEEEEDDVDMEDDEEDDDDEEDEDDDEEDQEDEGDDEEQEDEGGDDDDDDEE